MSSEREITLFMAQIFGQTDRHEDMIDAMKKVIQLNPNLNIDERNLLSSAYKNVIGAKRNSLRMMSAIIEHEESRGNTNRVEKLNQYKSTILNELEKYCNEFIGLIDTQLLPATKYSEARVFYEKLKADYYRYLCEAKPEEAKSEVKEKAKDCYENALEIAKNELDSNCSTSLGLILNYSVFLYEIVGQKQDAIDLAKKTYNECTSFIDTNCDNQYREAELIKQLLRENVLLWTQDSEQT